MPLPVNVNAATNQGVQPAMADPTLSTPMPTRGAVAQADAPPPILSINSIEVIYDHVILVLKGVSLTLPKGKIVAILGANGAGKSTTLKSISNLIKAERGDVTKGSIVFEGQEVHRLTATDLVRRGLIQVMEGRHCFPHLTVEENLLTGAYTRKDGAAAIIATWARQAMLRVPLAGLNAQSKIDRCSSSNSSAPSIVSCFST